MNTKFVVILIVAVIAMLGLLFAAYTIVSKTPEDLARKGDQAMEAGDYDLARRLYGSAVNKDPTIVKHLDKWISAIERVVPETEPAYYDAFRSDLMGSFRQASIVQRTNIEAYERELGLYYELLRREYSRSQADSVITRTTEALGNFDGVSGVDPNWPVLARYRGLAWLAIANKDGVIDEEQYEVIREDFESAIQADPSNEMSRMGLMRWIIYTGSKRSSEEDLRPVNEARIEAIAIGEEHLAQFPESPLVEVTLFGIQVESKGAAAFYGINEDDVERTRAILSTWEGMSNDLDALFETIIEYPVSKISMPVINRFSEIEVRVDSESQLSRTKALLERQLQAAPDSLELLVANAGLHALRGETDIATELYQRIVDMPQPPISIDGAILFSQKRAALLTIAAVKLDSYSREIVNPEADKDALDAYLAGAIEARDKYASRVTEDDPNLMLINGRVAFINGEFEESLRLLAAYNRQTENQNADGLWFEALAARNLNQLGTARLSLQNLLILKKHDVRALLVLGDVETRLRDTRSALERYQRVLVTDPNNETAKTAIQQIRAMDNPELIDDPVTKLVITARQVRRGKDGKPGDISEAITILSDGLESVDYAPQATVELVSLLLDQGDVQGGRALVAQARELHPDDESLAQMETALQLDDEVDILIAMVQQSDTPALEQLVSIAGIAFARNRTDIFSSTVAQLQEIAPEDSRVIDFAFVQALTDGDETRAKEIVELAIKNNTDRMNGVTYQARLAQFQEDYPRAIQILEQATSGGVADSSVFRMLAIAHRQAGQVDPSIEAFERALSIRPDDQQSIQGYIDTLIAFRKYPEALDAARRFQKFSIDNQDFLSVWLTLEAGFGGTEGQEFAIRQREKFFELDPDDMNNNFALASLYVENDRWDEARVLIDSLKTDDDSLRVAELEARWYANQGRIGNVNGLGAARQIYLDYIDRHPEDTSAEPFIALARFMLDRGVPEIAIQAANAAVERQDPETMDGTKLVGDLFMMLNQYTNAADSFREIVDAGADVDNVYRMRLIDMYIRTRQYEQANTEFAKLDTERANTKIALLQHSEIEEGLGNSAAAASLLDQAVSTFSDDPLVYIKRAEFLAGDRESLNDLLADIDAALRINSNDWRAYRIRAAAYFAVDERSDALRDLQRAVRLNPALDQALFGIINELMIDGRNGEAFEFANEIVESRARDASLMNSLGQLFSSRDDWERATEYFKRVWEIQRSPTAGAVLIDSIVRTRNPDTALANSIINDLTDIAGDINQSPGLLAAQALVLQSRGRDELAVLQLTKAFDLSLNSDQTLIQWSGNISRFFEDQPMQEQIDYLQSLKRRNTNTEVSNWLDLFIAQRLISVGSQLESAIGVYERLMATAIQPEIQRISHQSYGTTMFTQGNFERAAEIWAEGVELFPEDWEMSNNLAYVLSAELGKHEEGLELAQFAVQANSNRSEPYDTLGNIYIALGQYDEAEKYLVEGLKYALSARSRVTMVLAQINLDLARDERDEARSKLVDIRALVRAMPTRDVGLEADIDAIEEKINSDG
ncbi:MAG: tetratricopeptide repeat protein [Phycisphaerales bacterium]